MFASAEPFSKREAWMWLISEAAWKPRRRRVAGVMIDLNRGQVSHALRHLAECWGWSVKRVRGFLSVLEQDKMITTETGTGITVITICKYNEYQKVSLPKGTEADTPSGTRRAHEGHNIESKEYKEEDAAAATPRAIVSKEARDLADELCVIAGHSLDFVPPGWCGAALRVQAWLSAGWPPEIIIAGVKGAAVRKRGPPAHTVDYFENAVAELFARQSAPVPVVEIREASKLAVHNGPPHARSGQSLTDSIRRELAQLEGPEGPDLEVPASPVLRISH